MSNAEQSASAAGLRCRLDVHHFEWRTPGQPPLICRRCGEEWFPGVSRRRLKRGTLRDDERFMMSYYTTARDEWRG